MEQLQVGQFFSRGINSLSPASYFIGEKKEKRNNIHLGVRAILGFKARENTPRPVLQMEEDTQQGVWATRSCWEQPQSTASKNMEIVLYLQEAESCQQPEGLRRGLQAADDNTA